MSLFQSLSQYFGLSRGPVREGFHPSEDRRSLVCDRCGAATVHEEQERHLAWHRSLRA